MGAAIWFLSEVSSQDQQLQELFHIILHSLSTFPHFSLIFSLSHFLPLSISLWECESEIERFEKKQVSSRFSRGTTNPTIAIHHSPPIPSTSLLTSSYFDALKKCFKRAFYKSNVHYYPQSWFIPDFFKSQSLSFCLYHSFLLYLFLFIYFIFVLFYLFFPIN